MQEQELNRILGYLELVHFLSVVNQDDVVDSLVSAGKSTFIESKVGEFISEVRMDFTLEVREDFTLEVREELALEIREDLTSGVREELTEVSNGLVVDLGGLIPAVVMRKSATRESAVAKVEPEVGVSNFTWAAEGAGVDSSDK